MLASQKWLSVLFVAVALTCFAAGTIAAADIDKGLEDSIAGTEWVGEDTVDNLITTYRFEKGGKLAYHYNGQHYRNGTWKQTGAKVYFEINGQFREFDGKVSGDLLEGKSWNVKDRKWQTKLYRYVSPMPEE